jgi:hypothetical protein
LLQGDAPLEQRLAGMMTQAGMSPDPAPAGRATVQRQVARRGKQPTQDPKRAKRAASWSEEDEVSWLTYSDADSDAELDC